MYNFDAFMYRIKVPDHLVLTLVNVLVQAGGDYPNGSSFAVTSDAPRGERYIYLTAASYKRLVDLDIMTDASVTLA